MLLTAIRWLLSLLKLLLVASFLFSTRRAVMWDSADGRHEFVLALGR
jgi:hypothetical protein